MAGYVLILAILILGGIIATLGDRIGTKVGKSRLSVFNLRPRKTATLVTIVTGGLISASTLGILLATSSQLRDGLFRLESIRKDLENTQQEKQRVEQELTASQKQREQAQQRLDQINRSLSEALVRQSQTQAQLQNVRGKFQQAKAELEKVLVQEEALKNQIQSLTSEQEKLAQESQKLTQERDRLQSDLQKITSDREDLRQKVSESESRLAMLEKQRTDLNKEISKLEDSRKQLSSSVQALRRGNVAIQSEQVLAAAVIRESLSETEARQAIYKILQQAEQDARYLLDFFPGNAPTEPVIKITEAQIDLLLDRIKDGRSYVIRILSTGNYLRQETSVSIAADITPNKQIFAKGEVIASLPFKPNLPQKEMESRLIQLFSLVSFRAQREGVLTDPLTGKVGSFSDAALAELLKSMAQYKAPFEIQAVAKDKIFTASDLTLELVVIQDGVEIQRFS